MATSNEVVLESSPCGNATGIDVDKAQVLIVLSNNGVEEIPFGDLKDKYGDKVEDRGFGINNSEISHKMKKEMIYGNKKLTRTRNQSLPAKLVSRNEHGKQNEPKDYLQVPPAGFTSQTDGSSSRRASVHSIESKSSLSSFGIYSAPDTPMSLNSPSPSNASPNSVDLHRKFTFPQPQSVAELDIDYYVLGNYQSLSKSADPINEIQHENEFARSLEFTEAKSTSAIKSKPSKRKKSLLERLGSGMSDRSLISRRVRKSLSNLHSDHSGKDHSSENMVSFPKTKRSSTRQRFRITPAKTGQTDGISFESIDKPGYFLRSKGKYLEPEREGSDSYFNKDSTFVPLPDMWFKEFIAFESVGKPSFFIRLNHLDELVLDRYDGTTTFKEDASFQLKKRPCTTCLQVGVKCWVKLNFGGYSLGKVIAVNNEIEIEADGGKVMKIPRSNQECLIPDVVPQTDELAVGARVICQWLNRDFLYPGIITKKLSNGYKIQFDDGDNGVCQSHQIRLIRCHVFQEHSCKSQNHERLASQDRQTTTIAQIQGKNGDKNSNSQQSSDANNDKEHIIKEPVCQNDSLSSTESHVSTSAQIENSASKKQIRVAMKNLQAPLFETETMSQDSGYHGYQRQKNLDKGYRRNLFRTVPQWKSADEHIVNQL